MAEDLITTARLHPDLDERLAGRTPEQIAEGLLDDGSLDPRGYVVSCGRCVWQAWGTPDNLPMGPDRHEHLSSASKNPTTGDDDG